MIDTWLKNDLGKIFSRHPVAVLIDESGDAEFLLGVIDSEITVHATNSAIEELHVKFLIERDRTASKKHLIYTHTSRAELRFIREYCETNGCLEIPYLHNYVKEKVQKALNLNINLSKEDLITAAKISVGKSLTYWMDIAHKGETEIFDLQKELLPFIHDPDDYEAKFDPQIRENFYRKVCQRLGQEYIPKPARTLAGEVVKAMLDGMACGSCDQILEAVYKNWLDSIAYKSSFAGYLGSYSLPAKMDIWAVCPGHPFRQVDEQWLRVMGENMGNKETLPNYLARISRRNESEQARALGVRFWADVKVLLEFDPKDISYLSSFKECVDYYSKCFYKLDTAIRNLYTEFLNKRELLEPFQEYYKETVSIFLDKWFGFFDDYQEQQTGLLQRIIDENPSKIAIIVGDGVGFELASQIAARVNKTFQFTKKTILADVPSETENNMSRIFMADGSTERVHKNREKFLLEQNHDVAIDVINLDDVTEDARPAQILICTCRDIDELGEKLQQKALKYISDTTIGHFADQISRLLNSGYSKVYLVTDHGFVLTGLLSESDKITVSLEGAAEKAERYVRTVSRQSSMGDSFIELKKEYNGFKYVYFSKTINPFKTPGAYGYSHGGISPQEIITPCFCWERPEVVTSSLKISIENKDDLLNITGEVFPVMLRSEKVAGDIFSTARTVY